ncbi:MAG: hypothetical protein ACO1TE_06370 [Prosthecobacter sp.]
MMRLLLCLLPLVLLPGCATQDGVMMARKILHALPKKGHGETFEIVNAGKVGGLGFNLYATEAARILTAYGWRQSTAGGTPDYRVKLNPMRAVQHTLKFQEDVVRQVSGPTRTEHRGSFSNGYDTPSVRFTGTSYTPASYAVVGVRNVQKKVFLREVQIEIVSKAGQQVYFGTGRNTGPTSELIGIMPTLIKRVLSDFPGVNGEHRLTYH